MAHSEGSDMVHNRSTFRTRKSMKNRTFMFKTWALEGKFTGGLKSYRPNQRLTLYVVIFYLCWPWPRCFKPKSRPNCVSLAVGDVCVAVSLLITSSF